MPDKKKHDNPKVRANIPAVDPKAPERSIGGRIKAERERLGLNFEQLAALTREYDSEGIAAVTLRRYEREDDGGSSPGLRELRILCESLDVTADYLLMGRTPPEYLQRDFKDWEQLKEILARATKTGKPHGHDGPDPYSVFARQENLKRARLHTKVKGD